MCDIFYAVRVFLTHKPHKLIHICETLDIWKIFPNYFKQSFPIFFIFCTSQRVDIKEIFVFYSLMYFYQAMLTETLNLFVEGTRGLPWVQKTAKLYQEIPKVGT